MAYHWHDPYARHAYFIGPFLWRIAIFYFAMVRWLFLIFQYVFLAVDNVGAGLARRAFWAGDAYFV